LVDFREVANCKLAISPRFAIHSIKIRVQGSTASRMARAAGAAGGAKSQVSRENTVVSARVTIEIVAFFAGGRGLPRLSVLIDGTRPDGRFGDLR
jgi:hypothetical protein